MPSFCLCRFAHALSAALIVTAVHPKSSVFGQDVYVGPCQAETCNSTDDGVDVIIGSILPVQGSQGSKECVQKLTTGILSMWQVAEMVRWAVDLVNNDAKLLPDIRLGYNIKDGCSMLDASLQAAVAFVNSGHEICSGDETNAGSAPVIGIVGPAYSSHSQPTAKLLRLFKLPLVSPASTSSALDDKCRFPNFFRTIPSDSLQAKALVAISLKYGWKYISVIYSSDAYGINGAKSFRNAAVKSGICIALFQDIHPLKAYPSEEKRTLHYKKIMRQLLADDAPHGTHYRRAKVVLLWLIDPEAKEWLRLAEEDPEMRKANFTILAVSDWSTIPDPIKNVSLANGALGLAYSLKQPATITRYLQSLRLKPKRRGENPWLPRVYSEIYGCNLRASCANLTLGNLHKLAKKKGEFASSISAFVPGTVDAVFALAHALDATLTHMAHTEPACKNDRRKCIPKLTIPTGRDLFQKELRKVRFLSPVTRRHVGFVSGNPIEAIYEYYNVRRSGTEHRWVSGFGQCDTLAFNKNNNISNYCDSDTRKLTVNETNDSLSDDLLSCLNLSSKKLIFNDGTERPPTSACSASCKKAQIATVTNQQGQPRQPSALPCCWTCIDCAAQMYSRGQFASCQACPSISRVNANGTGCEKLPVERWKNDQDAAIPLVIISIATAAVMLCIVAWLIASGLAIAMPMKKSMSLLTLLLMSFSCVGTLLFGAAPSKVSCVASHLIYSISLVTPFLPGLVFAFYHMTSFAAAIAARKIIPANERNDEKLDDDGDAEEESSMSKDLFLLVSTDRRRWAVLAGLLGIIMVILAIVIAVDVPSQRENVTAHQQRIIWCPASNVMVTAVVIMIGVVLATGMLSLVAERISQNVSTRLVTMETHQFLSACLFFIPIFLAIVVASFTIYAVMDDVRHKLATLLYALVASQITFFFSLFASRLLYLRNHRVLVLERILNDGEVKQLVLFPEVEDTNRTTAPLSSINLFIHENSTAVSTA